MKLKLNGHTDMTTKDDECELGYWLGQAGLYYIDINYTSNV